MLTKNVQLQIEHCCSYSIYDKKRIIYSFINICKWRIRIYPTKNRPTFYFCISCFDNKYCYGGPLRLKA